MIRAQRDLSAAPPILRAAFSTDDLTELQRAEAHYLALAAEGKDHKTYDFSRYRRTEVKAALETIFHGKCAYCESAFSATQPVDVEHYRPKGPVEGVAGHPGYWWLAADWENLLPSCIDCNRRRNQITPNPVDWTLVTLTKKFRFDRGKKLLTGKQSAFPLAPGAVHVAAKEDIVDDEPRLLLDPTRDDPEDHLVFHVDRDQPLISLVYPKPLRADAMPGLPPAIAKIVEVSEQANKAGASPIGAASIQVYGLNRLGLVQARTRLLRDLEFLAHTSTELDTLRTDLQARLAERITARDALPLGDATRESLTRDIDLDGRMAVKLGELVASLRAKMLEKMDKRSPYAALAKAWVRAYVQADTVV